MQTVLTIDKNSWAKVENTFKNIVNGVISAETPLRESAQIVVDQATRNFGDQGYTYGKAWAPLKASTVRDRARKGYGARPILVRSGTLKGGTRVRSVARSQAVIENPVDYAPYHQFGTKKMPVRQILGVTEKIRHAISLVFVNYIHKLIMK